MAKKPAVPLRTGVWIDHKQAFVVEFKASGPKVSRIASNLQRKHKSTGGFRARRPSGGDGGGAEKKIWGHRMEEIHRYYVKVMAKLKNADEILVLGPSTAKIEFSKELSRAFKDRKDVTVVTTSRLTQNQLIKKVTHHFMGGR